MNLLQDYYYIYLNTKDNEFIYNNHHYYFVYIQQIKEFEHIYPIYLYYMNLCHIVPYQIIYNKNHHFHTYNNVLFSYHKQKINIQDYLYIFLRPLPHNIYIKDIKEQWIHKTDELRKHIGHNIEINTLIYFYTGLIENCITLLNQILNHNYYSQIPISLSLKHCVNNIQELNNPSYYVLSSRIKHLSLLIKSMLIDEKTLTNLLNQNILSLEEQYFLIASILYPHHINIKSIQHISYLQHLENINKVIKIYNFIYKILMNRISIIKISWLNQENML